MMRPNFSEKELEDIWINLKTNHSVVDDKDFRRDTNSRLKEQLLDIITELGNTKFYDKKETL